MPAALPAYLSELRTFSGILTNAALAKHKRKWKDVCKRGSKVIEATSRSCAFKSACQQVSASRRSVMPRHSCDRMYFLVRSLTTLTRRLTAWSVVVLAQTKILLQGVCSELPVQEDLGPLPWEHHHRRQTLTVCRCHTTFLLHKQPACDTCAVL